MENKETFIPHENDIRTPSKGGSILFFVSLVLFLASLGIGGFSYIKRISIEKKVSSYGETLSKSKERFNTGVPVRTIEQFDIRLRSAESLVAKHKSFAQLFSLIERITLKDVQFTSFSYNEINNTRRNVVRLIGRASDYKTIAEESEQFSLDEEAKRYITDVVFSNLDLEDSKNSSLIKFEIEFTVDPELLLYSRIFVPTNIINQQRDIPNIKNQ